MSSTSARIRDSQSIIPLVHPKWKRSVTSNDVQPSPLNREEDGDDICNVCRQCESRYKCPRCQIPYCSVACYKQHDTDGASCTELFYQDRVSTVLHYEAKEQSKSMQQILNRCHQVTSEDDSDQDEEVFEEALFRLAEALQNGTATAEDAERHLTPELRPEFERAVKNGELTTMIERWHAWWMPEFVSEQSPNADLGVHRMTLDERLLRVPSFRKLRTGPLPALAYNAVDLLYSIALTLRHEECFNPASQKEKARILLVVVARGVLAVRAGG
jgi:HIT zinc finger